MDEDIQRQLEPWRKKAFREGDLSLEDVISSLKSGNSDLIELSPNNTKTVWTVMNKATKTPACIHYAAVWAWGTPMHTGNFVPIGQTSEEVPEARVQVSANLRCEFSYVFETSDDFTLYEHMTALENYALEHTPFGKLVEGKPRTSWQNPETLLSNHRFILSSRVFVPKGKPPKRNDTTKRPLSDKQMNVTDTDSKEETKKPQATANYRLHPWIKAVVEKTNSRVAANPQRPRVLSWDTSTRSFKKVTETNGRKYARYDIVWFSFTPSFLVKPKVWAPQLQPYEFVGVGKIEGAPTPKHNTQWEEAGPPAIQPLEVDETESDLEEWEADAMANSQINLDNGSAKRKRSGEDDREMDVDRKVHRNALKGEDGNGKGKVHEGSVRAHGNRDGSPTPWAIVSEGVSHMDIDDEDDRDDIKLDQPPIADLSTPTTSNAAQAKRQTRYSRR